MKVINKPHVTPIRKEYQIAKRVLDLFLCVLVLPIALPAGLIVALAIRFDSPGPIFFVQMRTGKGGRRFRMYKFRTMVSNAEALKDRYSEMNQLSAPDFKIEHDPRVTRVGQYLRISSLDELPQIINIVKGEMSWVGPRPTSFGSETYRLWQTERLEVTPGLTGLWQVKGRGDIDFDERLKLDIVYIEKQSILFDIQILLQTVGAVLNRRGAH